MMTMPGKDRPAVFKFEMYKLDWSGREKRIKTGIKTYEVVPESICPRAVECIESEDAIESCILLLGLINGYMQYFTKFRLFAKQMDDGRYTLRVLMTNERLDSEIAKGTIGSQIPTTGVEDLGIEITKFRYANKYNSETIHEVDGLQSFIEVFKRHRPNCCAFDWSGGPLTMIVFQGTDVRPHIEKLNKNRVTEKEWNEAIREMRHDRELQIQLYRDARKKEDAKLYKNPVKVNRDFVEQMTRKWENANRAPNNSMSREMEEACARAGVDLGALPGSNK